ncbi:rhodanese-like domain-containing protein [Anaerocolumna sp. AGMB13025]|uniref:rhodanese-like domain-containing protein n=1 Tax=Anaerocolumna sp. AGMB13025 TaxID=3039116 RepID=UPI00241F17D8|nr:rhodanese-like domain-containing protein [Anaerocolumna sp. AGMB13025]WFR58730.1 rhodanese-like domain-containing protein [Anaerocolumna sp. AGMB13025]
MLGLLKNTPGKTIPVNKLDELIEKADIIDIREPYEYKTGSLRSTKNIPMDKLIANPETHMKRDKTYYIMCQSGNRSRQTCMYLTKQGYDVINVLGGIGAYTGSNRN